MTYEQYLNQAVNSIKTQGMDQMHDLGNGEKVPCKLNSFEYPDQKYTHCELCELDMNEAIENWDDRNYNSDPYYLDESTYEWAMEQDNG